MSSYTLANGKPSLLPPKMSGYTVVNGGAPSLLLPPPSVPPPAYRRYVQASSPFDRKTTEIPAFTENPSFRPLIATPEPDRQSDRRAISAPFDPMPGNYERQRFLP